MVDINRAFPSKYLKAPDLQGRASIVTIERVDQARIGDGSKLVAYFGNKRKGLPLNKTNARAIAEIAGTPYTEEWAGLAIELYPSSTEFAGAPVECIRIRRPAHHHRGAPPVLPPRQAPAPRAAAVRAPAPSEEFDSGPQPDEYEPPPGPGPDVDW